MRIVSDTSVIVAVIAGEPDRERLIELSRRHVEPLDGLGIAVQHVHELPVVGDPLCLVAGLLRVGLTSFVLLVGLGKLARYAFLAGLSI